MAVCVKVRTLSGVQTSKQPGNSPKQLLAISNQHSLRKQRNLSPVFCRENIMWNSECTVRHVSEAEGNYLFKIFNLNKNPYTVISNSLWRVKEEKKGEWTFEASFTLRNHRSSWWGNIKDSLFVTCWEMKMTQKGLGPKDMSKDFPRIFFKEAREQWIICSLYLFWPSDQISEL